MSLHGTRRTARLGQTEMREAPGMTAAEDDAAEADHDHDGSRPRPRGHDHDHEGHDHDHEELDRGGERAQAEADVARMAQAPRRARRRHATRRALADMSEKSRLDVAAQLQLPRATHAPRRRAACRSCGASCRPRHPDHQLQVLFALAQHVNDQTVERARVRVRRTRPAKTCSKCCPPSSRSTAPRS